MSIHHGLRAAVGASPSDPYFSSTVLLLSGNGSNGGQNNTFIDSSSNNFTITRNGNVAQGTFSPFTLAAGKEYSASTNGGSGYFDGSGDYLAVADSTAFDLPGDFAIEFWVYLTSLTSSSKYFSVVLGSESASQNGFTIYSNTTGMGVYSNDTYTIGVTNEIGLNRWYHIALTRSGTTLRFFIDGVQKGSATNSVSFTGVTGNGFAIGATYTSSFRVDTTGYFSNVRIVKGSAVYTGTFTPPTEPLTAITNTSLLLNFVNGSILDSTAKNDLETVGDAQISTSTKKFGTGSLKFDGTGDYLSVPDSANFDLTGDFTIECWINLSSTSNPFPRVFSFGTYNAANNLDCSIDTSTKYLVVYFNGTQYDSGTNTINFDTWYHIAIVRSGSTIKAYVDGTSKITISSATASVQRSQPFYVGNLHGYESSTTAAFVGYIDDFRLTKGVARYTSTFTPPTRQLPAR